MSEIKLQSLIHWKPLNLRMLLSKGNWPLSNQLPDNIDVVFPITVDVRVGFAKHTELAEYRWSDADFFLEFSYECAVWLLPRQAMTANYVPSIGIELAVRRPFAQQYAPTKAKRHQPTDNQQ